MCITKVSLRRMRDLNPRRLFTLLPFQGSALDRYANPPILLQYLRVL